MKGQLHERVFTEDEPECVKILYSFVWINAEISPWVMARPKSLLCLISHTSIFSVFSKLYIILNIQNKLEKVVVFL